VDLFHVVMLFVPCVDERDVKNVAKVVDYFMLGERSFWIGPGNPPTQNKCQIAVVVVRCCL
jgi:hypothetical protein